MTERNSMRRGCGAGASRRWGCRAFAVVLALALAFPAAAFAWNAAGHRLAAVIAWEELSAPVRAEAQRLLAAHPAAEEWRAKLGSDEAVLTFAEAATWPDELRRRSIDPAWLGRADPAAGSDWHYLNWPLGEARRAVLRGQLDRQLDRLSLALADHTRPDRERAEALAWLLHLVADAHQPLHVATHVGDSGTTDDAGGNGFEVFDPANPRLQQSNLHRFWDDLPGPPWLRGKRLLAVAAALSARHPRSRVAPADIETWLGESHRLAATHVYPGTSSPFTVDDAYRRQARALADERVAVAGARLGSWLDRLLRR